MPSEGKVEQGLLFFGLTGGVAAGLITQHFSHDALFSVGVALAMFIVVLFGIIFLYKVL